MQFVVIMVAPSMMACLFESFPCPQSSGADTVDAVTFKSLAESLAASEDPFSEAQQITRFAAGLSFPIRTVSKASGSTSMAGVVDGLDLGPKAIGSGCQTTRAGVRLHHRQQPPSSPFTPPSLDTSPAPIP